MDLQIWTCVLMSSTEGTSPYQVAGGLLLHPVALFATVGLWTNDHVLKPAYPGWVTGKLSDVCGVVLFPLLVVGVLEIGAWLGGSRQRMGARWVGVAALVTGIAFAAIQIWAPAGAAYEWLFGLRQALISATTTDLSRVPQVQHTMDPTDLLALPFLVFPVWLAWRHRSVAGRARSPLPAVSQGQRSASTQGAISRTENHL